MKISPQKLFQNPLFLLIETTCLIFIPLTLIFVFPKIMLYRTFVMLAGLGYIAVVMNKLNITVKTLGFQKNAFTKSVKSIFLPTVLLILSILFVYIKFPMFSIFKEVLNESAFIPLPFGIAYYVFVSVPLQEIIFFGFYLTRLTYVTHNNIFLCLYCSLIFMLIHTPYMRGGISILIGTFLLGIILSSNFLKYRNIYTLIIAHWCVGTLFILLEYLRL